MSETTFEKDPLYVIAVISNPRRYRTRYDLYKKFEKYIQDSGAILYTVETAFGDRPHAVTEPNNPFHIQLRSPEELWLKEAMINVGLSRLPSDWKYVAWIDADIQFSRPDWVAETKHMLQHYDVIQMFSVAHDLGPNFETFATHPGIFATYLNGGSPYAPGAEGYNNSREGHPGYCFSARRSAMETLGGVFDQALLGSGDRHMALGLIGLGEKSLQPGVSKGYEQAVREWCKRAAKLNANVGYMEGAIFHYFHGKKSLRGYNSRWKILIDNEFNPYTDVWKDTQGLWRFTDSKPAMRDQMRQYFAARNEDDISMD